MARKAAARKAPAKKAAAKKADTRSKAKQHGDEDEDDDEDDAVTKTRRRRAAKASDDDEDQVEDDEDDVEDDDEDIEKSDDDEDDDDADDADDTEEDEDEDEAPAKKSKKTPAKKGVKKTAPKKKVAKADDEDEGDIDDDEDEDDEVDDLDEEILKSLPAATRRRIEKNQRIAKEALEIAKEERNRRVTMEFIEKAKKDIPNLTGTHEEKGALLKALFSGEPVSKADAKAILKMLKAGDAAQRNLLMSEVGVRKSARTDDDSAYAELQELAEEILKSKEGKNMTREAAVAKAAEQHPEVYTRYRMEKRRARRRESADEID